MRVALLVLCLLGLGCSTNVEPADPSLLPLNEGSSWRYLRTRYVRGDVVDRDTFTVRVIAIDAGGRARLVRAAITGNDTVTLIARTSTRIDREDGSETRFIDLNERSAVAMFFPVLSPIHTRFTTISDRIQDSTVVIAGLTYRSLRIHQHIELLDDDGSVALKLDFQHAFIPGRGADHARFIADLSQCQACSLISEFYTFDLIDLSLRE